MESRNTKWLQSKTQGMVPESVKSRMQVSDFLNGARFNNLTSRKRLPKVTPTKEFKFLQPETLNLRKQKLSPIVKRETPRMCEHTISNIKTKYSIAPDLKASTEEVLRDLRTAINEDRKTIIMVKTA